MALTARLEGPKPWYATGTARFTFLLLDVAFDLAIGGEPPAEAPPRQNVLDLVVAALGDAGAWGPEQSATGPGVVLADPPEGASRLRPDDALLAVQRIAPLERALDVYGTSGRAARDAACHRSRRGRRRRSDLGARHGLVRPGALRQHVAGRPPGRAVLRADGRGVRLGAGNGVAFDADEGVGVVPTYEERILDEVRTRSRGRRRLAFPLATTSAGLARDLARGPSPVGVDSPTLSVRQATWRLADGTDGTAAGPRTTYAAAVRARDRAVAAGQARRGELRVAPSHAVVSGP